MDFRFFLLVNAMLFIRPAEFAPVLLGLPIYEVTIIACLLTSLPVVIRELNIGRLATQPVNACVVAMLPAIALSHLSNGQLSEAWTTSLEFSKVLLYYFLLVGVVNTPDRLRRLMIALASFATLVTAMTVLNYHGIVQVSAIQFVETSVTETSGAEMMLRRLGSTGLFQDPNDMSMMLITSTVICFYALLERRSLVWIVPIGLFGHALVLTRSRGGFLALVAGVLTYLLLRFGRRAIPLSAVLLPILIFLFAGRQTDFTLKGSTGQSRIELWNEGMELFRSHPFFGIGSDLYDDQIGHVAHNSFIHAYTELGFLGGTFFLGMVYLTLLSLIRLGGPCFPVVDPELRRMRFYVITIVVCYTVGMMTLSCCYTIPTYTAIGIATVYLRLAGASIPWPILPYGRELIQRLGILSVGFVVVTHLYLRFFGRFD